MYKKECPNCNGSSYSSYSKGKWTCPYCEEDLTEVEAVMTDDND